MVNYLEIFISSELAQNPFFYYGLLCFFLAMAVGGFLISEEIRLRKSKFYKMEKLRTSLPFQNEH